jgi:hypothetical protein
MENNNSEKKWYEKWWVWLIVGFFFIGLFTKKDKKTADSISTQSQTSNCIGNRDCISSVRNNFTSTNKTILNESYEGDGRFKITALDPQRGITFNAFVSTDCNCSITNVNVSDIN